MSDSEQSTGDVAHLEALVEQWFFETFHGSVVARSTEVWNVVHAAKDDLKRRLRDLAADGSTV